MPSSQPSARLRLVGPTCRCCTGKLTPEDERKDDGAGICPECRKHPEGARLAAEWLGKEVKAGASSTQAPAFSDAERSLIRNTYRFMGMEQLLALLNDRLVADRGAGTPQHTQAQLMQEIRDCGIAARDMAQGAWSDMRRRLAQARRDGVLAKIDEHTIDDFAVVFGLSPAQVMRLKDALGSAIGERSQS